MSRNVRQIASFSFTHCRYGYFALLQPNGASAVPATPAGTVEDFRARHWRTFADAAFAH